MCWEKKNIIFFFTDWGFDWSFKVMKYKMKYNKEMHQSCERDKIVKNPWIAIKYRSSIKGQWRRKKGRNIFYLQCWADGCGCGDKITKPEERRWECVHTDRLIFTSRPQADGRWRHPGTTSQSTISSNFGGRRNVKQTCVHCVFSIQEPICSPSQIVNMIFWIFI